MQQEEVLDSPLLGDRVRDGEEQGEFNPEPALAVGAFLSSGSKAMRKMCISAVSIFSLSLRRKRKEIRNRTDVKREAEERLGVAREEGELCGRERKDGREPERDFSFDGRLCPYLVMERL